MDKTLKELFDYFKESTENEFEAFETKTIQVNNIREAAKLLQNGNNNETLPPHQSETKTEEETFEAKPILKPEAVQVVFDIIKDFFKPEQQTELKQILETGENASEKLLFKDNGNRLTDTFKKLFEYGFIIGCQKRDLINWIILNFTFIKRNKETVFVFDTVEKIISRETYPCKSPLIEINKLQIQKSEKPRVRKQNKY